MRQEELVMCRGPTCCLTETQLDVQNANGLGVKRLQLAPQDSEDHYSASHKVKVMGSV